MRFARFVALLALSCAGVAGRPRLGALMMEVERRLVVAEVVEGSAADSAGVRRGDLVITVDGEPVSSLERLKALVGARRVLLFKVARRGDDGDDTLLIRVRLPD